MIDHIAFVVDDIEEAVNWYKANTPASIISHDEAWAMLELFDTKMALILPGTHPAHFAIKCETTASFPCNEKEIKVHRDGSQYYYLKDPYGNAIEWVHYPQDVI